MLVLVLVVVVVVVLVVVVVVVLLLLLLCVCMCVCCNNCCVFFCEGTYVCVLLHAWARCLYDIVSTVSDI